LVKEKPVSNGNTEAGDGKELMAQQGNLTPRLLKRVGSKGNHGPGLQPASLGSHHHNEYRPPSLTLVTA
jgi:hypothetical protein